MNLRSTIAVSLLGCAAALVLPGTAAAQYWSLGVSIGGGTNIAVHGGVHLGGNTDRRRSSGLTAGWTEIELVVGLPRHARPDGTKRGGLSFGINVRRTATSGLSIGTGVRIAPFAADGTTDWQTVFHIPVIGWEPYPLPTRLFLFHELGRRLVPTDGGGLTNKWGTFIARPMLQVYLKHTGGFHYT